MKKHVILVSTFLALIFSSAFASSNFGIVNFHTCITDSKYGQHEQKQMENLRKQWTSLIQETEKEFTAVSKKLNDEDYLDGISPEAEQELKNKYKALGEDLQKYQSQLYQILNQAQYFFIQKMNQNIGQAASEVAKANDLSMIVNKEACFYSNPKLEITKQVIDQMDKNYKKDVKGGKLSENTEDGESDTLKEESKNS
ncbi:MAG TPA: OmpH family outer membrane protein [Chlamydiales bacterium]|nr:OmpH family outer membrane protein [Chlamydiales bacterium]